MLFYFLFPNKFLLIEKNWPNKHEEEQNVKKKNSFSLIEKIKNK